MTLAMRFRNLLKLATVLCLVAGATSIAAQSITSEAFTKNKKKAGATVSTKAGKTKPGARPRSAVVPASFRQPDDIRTEPLAIQKMYGLVVWLVPQVANLPGKYRVTLGNRVQNRLYDIWDQLTEMKTSERPDLKTVNANLEVLRQQTRLLSGLGLISRDKYRHASELIGEVANSIR